MKQDKQAQIEKTDEMISLGTEIFGKIEPKLQEDDFDDRVGLKDSITQTIRKKREKISLLDDKKEEIVMKIIGQMYNGTLVKEKLSIRKGRIYVFRCRYNPSMSNVKETIMANLQEVAQKIPKQSLDVLEFVLQKVYANPNSHIKSNYWNRNEGSERQKIIRIPLTKVLEIDNKDEKETKNFSIHFTNGILIDDSGEVKFFYEFTDKIENKLKTEFPRLESETFAGLYLKYEKEIEDNAKEFVDELDIEINSFEKELELIKDKGQNQLALCELSAEPTEMRN
jgi:hypothetical protein